MTDPRSSTLRKIIGEQPKHLASTNNDNRELGDYQTRYGLTVWLQIVIELAVVVVYLAAALYGIALALWLRKNAPTTTTEIQIAACMPWAAVFFAGIAGGSLFALKFLYHTVAKNEWNRDRILWRFIVPVNSGVLAVCSGFGVSSGIVPFLDPQALDNLYASLFFGFFLGYFADHALARLQRLALEWFGTVDKPAMGSSNKGPPPASAG